MKILIIEDDNFSMEVMRDMLSIILPESQIIIAADGKKGLDLLDNESVSMVFSDINMPVMDGSEFIRIVRHERKLDLPVICTTAHAIVGDREKMLSQGFTAYISKPIDFDTLSDLVEKHWTEEEL